MCPGLVETAVNPLLKTSLGELLTKLVTEKSIGRIACGRQKILLLVMLYHGKERLRSARVQVEVVVVDDHIEPFAETGVLPIQVNCQCPDIVHCLNGQAFEVHIEHIVGFVVLQTILKAQERTVLESHHRLPEDQRVHLAQVMCHLRHKLHLCQDIPFEVYAGSDLNKLQAASGQPEDGPLGDVVDGLPPTAGVDTAEGNLLDPAHKLLSRAAVDELQSSFLNRRLPSRGEGPQEVDGLSVLTDINEPTCPCKCRPKAAHVHIALFVDLSQTEEGLVEATSVIKVELTGLVDIAWALTTAPKLRPPAGIPPMPPGSTVSVIRSRMFSSLATAATPSGMPMPRFTTALIFRNIAARLAMTLRMLRGRGVMLPVEILISPV